MNKDVGFLKGFLGVVVAFFLVIGPAWSEERPSFDETAVYDKESEASIPSRAEVENIIENDEVRREYLRDYSVSQTGDSRVREDRPIQRFGEIREEAGSPDDPVLRLERLERFAPVDGR